MILYPTAQGEGGILYPNNLLEGGHGYPRKDQFQIVDRDGNKGKAVYSLTGHARGEMIARFNGAMIPYRTQHTLQVNAGLHVLDMHFVGLLAHSCSPNVLVDMQAFEIWALQEIAPDTALTMDYASTEDELFTQFRCHCGSPSCRHWITGRKERVNGEGLFYLRSLEELEVLPA